jgi:hypothetical protein
VLVLVGAVLSFVVYAMYLLEDIAGYISNCRQGNEIMFVCSSCAKVAPTGVFGAGPNFHRDEKRAE